MISLPEKCLASASLVVGTVQDDRIWRAFGYKRRPRRGAFFDRFIPKAALEREATLWHELSAASFASVVRWAESEQQFPNGSVFLAKVMEYCIDGIGGPLWPAMRFNSRHDAIAYFADASVAYADAIREDQSNVMVERLRDFLVQPLPPTWIVGAAYVHSHPESSLLSVASVMNEIAPQRDSASDIAFNDRECHYAIMRVLTRNQSGIPDDDTE